MADQYRTFQVNGVTLAQVQTLLPFYKSLDKTEASISLLEHNPTTQILTISFGGTDLSALLTRFRSFCQTRLGRLPDVDESRSPGSKVKTANDIRSGN